MIEPKRRDVPPWIVRRSSRGTVTPCLQRNENNRSCVRRADPPARAPATDRRTTFVVCVLMLTRPSRPCGGDRVLGLAAFCLVRARVDRGHARVFRGTTVVRPLTLKDLWAISNYFDSDVRQAGRRNNGDVISTRRGRLVRSPRLHFMLLIATYLCAASQPRLHNRVCLC